jgi:hypothetical protein
MPRQRVVDTRKPGRRPEIQVEDVVGRIPMHIVIFEILLLEDLHLPITYVLRNLLKLIFAMICLKIFHASNVS